MLRCADGMPYESEKSFMMSTHICKHCGQHKRAHSERANHALTSVDASDNELTGKGKKALQQAAGSR